MKAVDDHSYKTFLVFEDGSRTLVNARSIIIEIAPNHKLELDLAPHPNHRGGLPILAGSAKTHQDAENLEESYSRLVIRPGAVNVVHVSIESH
ncbi:MAG: hypothetical protein AAGG02_09770 [Cyanobacteria bacterium P01_H01_bin.15]